MPYVQSDDSARWDAAFELYDQDLLDEAWELIRDAGTGPWGSYLRWYRAIEAERASRALSIRERLNDRLTLEFVAGEVGTRFDDVVRATLETCDDLDRRLDVDRDLPVLVAILARAVDAPWATNRHGYCARMVDYDKICLPAYVLDDMEEYRAAMAHEYAHTISYHLAGGGAPQWLEEAISVLVEDLVDEEARAALESGEAAWLGPQALEAYFEGEVRPSASSDSWLAAENPASFGPSAADDWAVSLAYEQAGAIGEYLMSIGDEKDIARFLREIGRADLWSNLVARFRGSTRVGRALEVVYGFDERGLFERTESWLRDSTSNRT